MRAKITQELIQQLFNYNSETGDLKWKRAPYTKSKKGLIVRTKRNGYYTVKIYGKDYLVHRIIWLYVYGYFPENDIDHIDRNRINNKISNLREVSRQCNQRNVGLRRNNKTGIIGISFNTINFVWLASISVNNKYYNLGQYRDYTEAVCVRLAAEQCLNWHSCATNSPAYQYVKSWLYESENLEELYA